MKVLELIELASGYYWFMTEQGALLNDPDPEASDEMDVDYSYDGLLVFCANAYRERHGEAPLTGSSWEQAGTELGLNPDEVHVLFYTANLDQEHFNSNDIDLGRKLTEKYWNPWLRDKLEEGLLDD